MPEPGEVKAARNRAGLTQQQLADILGVHVKTLRDYEKGKRARLRAGQAKLADFIAANPEPQKAAAPPAPTAGFRPLAEASDMELIAVLTARLALLRAAVEGPIPAAVDLTPPTVLVQTLVSATPASTSVAEGADTEPVPASPPSPPSSPSSQASADPAPDAEPASAPTQPLPASETGTASQNGEPQSP